MDALEYLRKSRRLKRGILNMGMQLIYRSSNFENLFEMIVNNELKIGDLG